MGEYKTRMTQITVTKSDIFAEDATILEINDEGGGEYVTMRQPDAASNPLAFDHKNWPAVREAMDQLFKCIEEHENDTKPNRKLV